MHIFACPRFGIMLLALGLFSASSLVVNAGAFEDAPKVNERGNYTPATTLSRQLAERGNASTKKDHRLNAANGAESSKVLKGDRRNSYGGTPNNIKEYLDKLVLAYPDAIERHDGKFLFLKNGTRVPISDNKTDKTFDELLAKPDIDDMFYVPYPAGTVPTQPALNSDPGRVRFEPLFVAMYGDCTKHEVVKNLRIIKWLPKHAGGSVSITKINGVDKVLEAVSRELDELPNDLLKFSKPAAGTYNCRPVAGTNNKSMHAYAAALDINSKYSNYWRWSLGSKAEPKWHNQIPIEIIRIFERHGFIWGGYWCHYDTMHFEYRPELLPSKGSAG